jgi:heme exporter protein C
VTALTTPGPPGTPGAPAHTGSTATRVLGLVALAAIALWAYLGLVGTPPDEVQGDAVRLLYVHVPVVTAAYLSCFLATFAGALWLWKRSPAWDVLGAAAVEVAAVFTAATLVTGAIWGGAAWGRFWVWDARITSTALLFLVQLGYLALRRVPAGPGAKARRSAVLALLLTPNIFIINQSVTWWRSVHQTATVFQASFETKIHDSMLFAFFWSIPTAALVLSWLLVHRFRVGWLEEQVERQDLEQAIVERRDEAA